jgi:DNA-binding response OmpR family regulator
VAARLLLHVDDDQNDAFLLQRAVRKSQLDSIWRCDHLATGAAAVEYLGQTVLGKAQLPDLLVLDVKMPGMGGLEVLEWAVANVPRMPAVMLTSSDLLQDRLRARDLGSCGYFVKTPSFSDLLEFMRAWETHRFGGTTAAAQTNGETPESERRAVTVG